MPARGTHFIRALPTAIKEAKDLCPSTRDFFILKDHSLKLCRWPGENGMVEDLEWCWVAALKGQDIGELKITDVVGGNNNLRVFFYVGEKRPQDTMSNVWVLMVMQKKSEDILKGTLKTLAIRRKHLIKREY
jgi:hypothetical protein